MTFLTEPVVKGTDWRAVERAVARVMSHCGWKGVRVVGGSGDSGGDVIGLRPTPNGPQVYVVQVKAITGGNYVGPGAIQEALDALAKYSGDVCVVATNGDFTGTACRRRDVLNAHGFDVRLWNGTFLSQLLAKWPDHHHERQELRPYQESIVRLCLDKFAAGTTRAQFVVATGLGKTVIAAKLLDHFLESGMRRALILCHVQELALQLEQQFWYQLDKSVPTSVFFEGAMPRPRDGVNFGLYQTFSSWLPSIEPEEYDVVIVDEAHHALAHGFRRALSHLRPKFLVGMTATPWRGDGLSIDQTFGTPVARVSLVDGMKMGYLARVDYRIYVDTINWEALQQAPRDGVSIRDLNKRLFVPQRDEAIVEEIVRQCEGLSNPKAMVFCASIEHCARFADLLVSSSRMTCKRISGLDKVERNRVLMEFASGRIQAVTAVDVLNEGIDVPDVNLVVFLRSTHSRRIFVQQLGRGLRLAPGKDRLLVLDFVTDIRRIAEVMQMDDEARRPTRGLEEFRTLYFPDGIVKVESPGALPFAEQWLHDVADLADSPDSHLLEFPEPLELR